MWVRPPCHLLLKLIESLSQLSINLQETSTVPAGHQQLVILADTPRSKPTSRKSRMLRLLRIFTNLNASPGADWHGDASNVSKLNKNLTIEYNRCIHSFLWACYVLKVQFAAPASPWQWAKLLFTATSQCFLCSFWLHTTGMTHENWVEIVGPNTPRIDRYQPHSLSQLHSMFPNASKCAPRPMSSGESNLHWVSQRLRGPPSFLDVKTPAWHS